MTHASKFQHGRNMVEWGVDWGGDTRVELEVVQWGGKKVGMDRN